MVFASYIIKLMVVNIEAKPSIQFLYKEDREGK